MAYKQETVLVRQTQGTQNTRQEKEGNEKTSQSNYDGIRNHQNHQDNSEAAQQCINQKDHSTHITTTSVHGHQRIHH